MWNSVPFRVRDERSRMLRNCQCVDQKVKTIPSETWGSKSPKAGPIHIYICVFAHTLGPTVSIINILGVHRDMLVRALKQLMPECSCSAEGSKLQTTGAKTNGPLKPIHPTRGTLLLGIWQFLQIGGVLVVGGCPCKKKSPTICCLYQGP